MHQEKTSTSQLGWHLEETPNLCVLYLGEILMKKIEKNMQDGGPN